MTTVDEFAGNWIYRSFINNPEFTANADEVLLATGDLILEIGGAGGAGSEVGGVSAGLDIDGDKKISGKQSFHNGFNLDLIVSGTAKAGKPPAIRFSATGIKDTQTEGWIYDFIGHLAPFWPKGKEQRPAIVGTVIRTVDHWSTGEVKVVRPAGFTMSFIAVSRDHPAGS